MNTSLMMSHLQETVAPLFRSPSETEIGSMAADAKNRFMPWQFERLLNSAADLLDRASEQRSVLLGLLAQDFEQGLQIEAASLGAKHEAARVKLGEKPLAEPIAQAIIPLFKMSTASRTYDKIHEFHEAQDRMLAELEQTNSAAQRIAATAQRRSLDAERQKFSNQTILHQREWQAEQEDFDRRVEAAKLAREHADRRAKAAANGGVLDFRREARIVGQRILRDFNEASARLLAARDGLSSLLAMPRMTDAIPGALPDEPVIDAVISTSEAVRQMIEWHAVRTQHDQGFSVVFSVRSLCDDETWSGFIAGQPVSIRLNDRYFTPWAFPRLRGIAAESTGSDLPLLRLKIGVPAHARRSDGVPIDQTRVPPCYLGRVASRLDTREPETNGSVTLMNVCPVADGSAAWSVQIETIDPVPLQGLGDVHLRLSCVGVPVQFADAL